MAEPEVQDLHIARPAPPDQNWSRMQPMFIQPTQERLDKGHQIVEMRNSTDKTPTLRGPPIPQKHIIIDRFNQGNELQPGESKSLDMLKEDIEYFLRERRLGRLDHLGMAKPQHPIEIVGFDPDKVLAEQQPSEPQKPSRKSG
jgi:hypothetical protein